MGYHIFLAMVLGVRGAPLTAGLKGAKWPGAEPHTKENFPLVVMWLTEHTRTSVCTDSEGGRRETKKGKGGESRKCSRWANFLGRKLLCSPPFSFVSGKEFLPLVRDRVGKSQEKEKKRRFQ